MIKIKQYIALSLVFTSVMLNGCKKPGDFGDMNIDPTQVPNPTTKSLFTNSLQALSGSVTTATGQAQSLPALVIGPNIGFIWAQHMSEGPYLTSSNYGDAAAGQSYWAFYTGALINLKKIIDANNAGGLEAEVTANGSKNNQLAAARILKAFVFWKLTDRWGDLPYEEALLGATNLTPKYQKQELIYADLFKELKEASAQIDGGAGIQGDILLGGDMAMWKKFAATQRLFMALRLSKLYPSAGGLASTEFNAALPDVIGAGEDIAYKYLSGDPINNNPWYVNYSVSNRNDFAVSEPLVRYMRANGSGTDPRLPVFAEILPNGTVRGLEYGRITQANIPNVYSRLGTAFRQQDSPGYWLTYAQVCFAKAEAAKLGWISGGDASAKTFYEEGIDSSLALYGVASPTFKNETGVAYAPATAIQQISTQRWIHLFLNGWEAWSEWRRTGFPVLTPGPGSTNTAGGIPRRQAYPVADKTSNRINYEAVIVQQGPDNINTRMWWDKPNP